ncbi:hypothetical protein KAR91_76170 [Candidatus Pacearchaeota archaeon]|nr:hypothetical protein [Candidatus Pacearchaeota archaeon]
MKINLGVLATGASGSSAGVTASRNRYGYYLRARTSPVNPNTSRQIYARAVFTYAAWLWSHTLTQAQREAWEQYAAAIVWKGSLGLDCKLTGFNHFLRSCSAIQHSSGTIVNDGPVVLTLPGSDPTFAVTIDEANQEMSVVFDNTLPWANVTGGHLLVAHGSPKGVGREYLGGPYRIAGVIDGVTGTPPTSPATIDTVFHVAEDQKVECQARIIELDGRVSTPFRHSSSVTA